MADLSAYTCTPRQIHDFTIDCIMAGLVPFIKSSPGMGKSSIVKAIAKLYNLKLIDVRLSMCTPEDLQGLPEFYDILNPDGTILKRAARFVPFEMFPTANDNLPINSETGLPYDGWLIFFDEFNSAGKEVQAATYKILLDRMIGQYPLHPQVAIVCAGNLETDKAIVNSVGTAIQSRVITLVMGLDHAQFMEDVAFRQNWDSRIVAYLSYKNGALHDFNPDHDEHTFCCPRTWEFMNRLIQGKEVSDRKAPLYAGTITSGTAVDFIQFTKVFASLPRLDDIVYDPEKARLPQDPPTAYATITHLIEKMKDDIFEPIATYVARIERIEIQVLFYRGLMIRHPQLRSHPTFRKAMVRLNRYLHDDDFDNQSSLGLQAAE